MSKIPDFCDLLKLYVHKIYAGIRCWKTWRSELKSAYHGVSEDSGERISGFPLLFVDSSLKVRKRPCGEAWK